MKNPSLPPEDLPRKETSPLDNQLKRELEQVTAEHFYCLCNPKIQKLLSSCEWYITNNANSLSLVIASPDMPTNWEILNHIVFLASWLEQFSPTGKIRIYPPLGKGSPIELRVDERSIYQDFEL
jgi:hypothetical protein